jgi:opacity protein-like surface antigen
MNDCPTRKGEGVMKRFVVLSCALFLFSVPASAQEESKFHFLANGGLSLPQSPDAFKDGWSSGFNLGGGVGYRLSRHFTVQALVNYDRFPFDEAGVMDLVIDEVGIDPRDLGISVDIQGADASVLSVSGELKASFIGDPDKISPYVIGGAGIARLSISDTRFTGSVMGVELLDETLEGESETNWMATFGGGVDIPLNQRVSLFFEGRYQLIFPEGDSTGYASFRGGAKIGL